MGKLDARAVESIFIRYFAHSKGYVFARECGGGEMMEIESHDIEFKMFFLAYLILVPL